ncbi:hypothetical protein IWQ60_002755 [Tieghemiomyces parasiticus]|uniref:Uncharacterized protein n=1 Tax=Tieghemiomyces parasiticus TaxID=78921 RepID=A0A9W8ABL3_9FUNG|nr:hypothetical protein IWQ60_002755 [Tieghemiomyces parasiticus]
MKITALLVVSFGALPWVARALSLSPPTPPSAESPSDDDVPLSTQRFTTWTVTEAEAQGMNEGPKQALELLRRQAGVRGSLSAYYQSRQTNRDINPRDGAQGALKSLLENCLEAFQLSPGQSQPLLMGNQYDGYAAPAVAEMQYIYFQVLRSEDGQRVCVPAHISPRTALNAFHPGVEGYYHIHAYYTSPRLLVDSRVLSLTRGNTFSLRTDTVPTPDFSVDPTIALDDYLD